MMKNRLFLCVMVSLFCGCGVKISSQKAVPVAGSGPGVLTPDQARQATYRYAFSAQVVQGNSQNPVPQFSVSVVGADATVKSIVNPLGEKNGMFHISRASSSSALPVTLVVSAPGYQSVVQPVDVGSDCVTTDCAPQSPVSVSLRVASAGAPAASNAAALTIPAGNLPPTVASQLFDSGKIEGLWNMSSSQQTNAQALIILGAQAAAQAPTAVQGLLGGVPTANLTGIGSIIGAVASVVLPIIMATNPQLAAGLAAVKAVLNYLQPLLTQVASSSSGPFAAFLKFLLGSGWAGFGITPPTGTTSPPTLASTGLPSNFLSGFFGSANPFDQILSSILTNPQAFTGAQGASQAWTLLANYLQPLIQGLNTSGGQQLATLFNQLLTQYGGIQGLASFPKTPADLTTFGSLAAFIQPLVAGLNSADATQLLALLTPILNGQNPASVLQHLLDPGSTTLATAAATFFPALQTLVQNWLPGKQVFAAQILQGLMSGNLSGVKILQDFTGSPTVMVSGQAASILKLAQLPNIEKVVLLNGN